MFSLSPVLRSVPCRAKLASPGCLRLSLRMGKAHRRDLSEMAGLHRGGRALLSGHTRPYHETLYLMIAEASRPIAEASSAAARKSCLFRGLGSSQRHAAFHGFWHPQVQGAERASLTGRTLGFAQPPSPQIGSPVMFPHVAVGGQGKWATDGVG